YQSGSDRDQARAGRPPTPLWLAAQLFTSSLRLAAVVGPLRSLMNNCETNIGAADSSCRASFCVRILLTLLQSSRMIGADSWGSAALTPGYGCFAPSALRVVHCAAPQAFQCLTRKPKTRGEPKIQQIP